MTDVQSFEESQKHKLSNIIFKIVNIGIEKSNKRENGSTWRGKHITIQDQTGLIKVLMAWDDQSKSFEEYKSYKVYDLSWKPHKDSMQPQLSTVTKIEQVDNFTVQKKIESEKPLSSDEFFKQRQKEIEQEQMSYSQKIKSLMEKHPEYVIEKKEQLEKLLILDCIVNESLTTDDKILPHPQKVGLFMKILNEVKT